MDIANYVQRDVRQLMNDGVFLTFSSFFKLCAGRTAQEINLSSFGGDAGIFRILAWSVFFCKSRA